MGYVRQKIYDLHFENDEFSGLEIKCRSVTIDTFMRVCELTGDGIPLLRENEKRIGEIMEIVADTLIEWNLEKADGSKVTCDLSGLIKQDKEFVLTVIDAWINAMAGISTPSTSQEQEPPVFLGEIPMEVAS